MCLIVADHLKFHTHPSASCHCHQGRSSMGMFDSDFVTMLVINLGVDQEPVFVAIKAATH